MKQKLAIVIPAYKATYLEKALNSIESQTCKAFNIYIGNDNSPENIEEIVRIHSNNHNLFYTKFENNIGGRDLVAQWLRCIGLTQGEEWIWLFSDDDEMDANCVERFFEAIESDPDYDLYHFNVIPIDKYSKAIHLNILEKDLFPKYLGSRDFVKKRLSFKLNSFVVEYIFKREAFEKCGGFQNFDLAWGSDDATWAKIAFANGICNIEGAFVRWRYSGNNITSIESEDVMRRKGFAIIELLSFYNKMFKDKDLRKWYYFYYLHMLYNVMKSCPWNYVKEIIHGYKRELTDFVPLLVWRIVYILIH